MKLPNSQKSGGFTLVEVLIAVTVFSILAASAYVALDTLSRAADRHRQRSESFAALQLAVARLDSDLRQLVTRAVATPGGRAEPALLGQSDQLAGTRAGWVNMASSRRSTLQRFGWQQGGSGLERLVWPVTDRTTASLAHAETVLPDVESLRFSYRDHAGRWRDEWPVGEEAASLPAAIEAVVETRSFGRVRRVVVLQ
ncbi:MAG TPA: type II secretion system minor pseudopilin GspJ [Wenzhouxiangella sp.]|nr:type II secretion system minor pseudopilin GspJ [Wenzhouxiangella sp.]